ncbi:transposase [Waddlia chondrophila WSU 86-1044]|uniref:Transposase n=1 Tax=Waddlia chondrophila (strain ATCC VR-1470 / WSU 86-1044) TaxID=716544 RepID=D6YWD8_WADCW|nr:transposase [Waddlia chondrophila WSU 86-1044]
MKNDVISLDKFHATSEMNSLLEQTLREGARLLKQQAIENEECSEGYSSAILPKYLRRVPSLDAVIPALYLRGISTSNFQDALEAIMGKDAKGLSAANNITSSSECEKGHSNLYGPYQRRLTGGV